MKISVIVSTYNNPRFLDMALTGYGVQTDSDFDVIVADDGSGPETAELIESHKSRWPYALHHVWQEDDGFRKCGILNKAIAASDADYLIFTDQDCIARSDLVAAHRRFSKRGHYIYGSGVPIPAKTAEIANPDDVLQGRMFSLSWLSGNGCSLRRWRILRMMAPPGFGAFLDAVLHPLALDRYGRFPGCHSSCFRADALEIGGFNEKMGYGGLDWEFGIRLRNSGIASRSLKYATFMLQMSHERPWRNEAEMAENRRFIHQARRFGVTDWRAGSGK